MRRTFKFGFISSEIQTWKKIKKRFVDIKKFKKDIFPHSSDLLWK